MISQPVSSIFPVLHCPLGLGELQARPFLDVVFPPLPLSASSSSPFPRALQDGLARPDEEETCPQHFSLCLFTMIRRSSCGPIACWITAQIFSLVTWSLYKMRSILWQHLISVNGLYSSLQLCCEVHDSQTYRKINVVRERTIRTLELREMILSFKTGFNLVNAAVVCAIMETSSGLEPLADTTEPRYLKLVPVLS